MIKVYSGNEVGGGGRPHYRSPEFSWPNLTGTNYTSVIINHNLDTFALDVAVYWRNSAADNFHCPYDYYYNSNSVGTNTTMGWTIIFTTSNQVQFNMCKFAAGYGMMDLYKMDSIPGV